MKSCRRARPYPGTAGRIENAQVGVFLGYAIPKGRALLDQALDLTKAWAEDAGRRAEAMVPEAVRFATERVQARRWSSGRWPPGCRPVGDRRRGVRVGQRLPHGPGGVGLGYMLGVRTDQAVCAGGRQVRARALPAEVPTGGWHQLSCGVGAKGPRRHNGAALPTNCPNPRRYAQWLLGCRSVADPAAVAYFRCGGPPGTPLAELVRVAGMRWAIVECFGLAKGECGLSGYEVRSWVGWHRHVTLSL